MVLSKKQNGGIVFENCTGTTVNNILTDDEANEEFNKIDGNITGVDWEAELPEQEIQEPAVHMTQTNNNKYEALTGDVDNDEK